MAIYTCESSLCSLGPSFFEPLSSISGFFMVKPSSSSSSSSSLSSPQSSCSSSSFTLTTGWLQSSPPTLSLAPQAGAGAAEEPQSKPPWVPFSNGWLAFTFAFDGALLGDEEPDFRLTLGILESTSRAKTGQPTYRTK